MIRKNIIGLVMAMTAVGVSDATIYIVKEGKVVASYSDDAVDAITFEDPTIYDFETENVLMHTTYYADAVEEYGYNYYVYLSDKHFDDKGMLPMDATLFTFRIKTSLPVEDGSLLLPPGTYTLGSGTSEGTYINPELSYVKRYGMEYHFTDATLTVSCEEGTSNIIADIKVTDVDGKTYRSSYKGETSFEDQSIKWFNEDLMIQQGTLTATYLKNDTGFDTNCNMNIMIASQGYDENGWLVIPSDLVTLVGNVKLDANGNLEPTTWNIMEGDVAEENTLLAGKIVNFMGGAFPVNTNVKHYIGERDIEVGLVKSGSVTVSQTSPGQYRFMYDFTTNTGHNLKGIYFGKIEIKGLENEETWHLDSDHTLDLDGAVADCTDFGSEVKLDVVHYNQNMQWVGERVDMRLNPKDGFGPGIYKVSDDGECAGTITAGTHGFTWSTGSVFVKYEDDGSGNILKCSGITDGQIEIIDEGDGIWTINYDLVDDQPEKHRITGSWTGSVNIQ